MRLDRLLANMGVGSRKEVKKMISSGCVTVDGLTERDPGREADENSDRIEVNGTPVHYRKYVYLMMNKPSGVISASRGNENETVASDLVGTDYSFYGLSPAGRLDKDSEGFLLLTNDGDFIHNIISPGKNVEKRYYVETDGVLTEEDGARFRRGVTLEDGYECLDAALEILETGEGRSRAIVTVHEGKFHQVKRMIASCGKTVTYLKRLSIGGVLLDEALAPGQYRELREEELNLLKNGVNHEKTDD